MAKGDRWSDDPDVKVREMRTAETVLGVIRERSSRPRPLESCLRSKDSRAVWRGAEGIGRSRLSARTYEPRHQPRPRQPPTLPPVRIREGLGVQLPRATRRNIYVRSRRSGERVMASACRFLTTRLQLKVNESKSAVARSGERKFLGFTISNDAEPTRQIAAKALQKFQDRIRELTSRTLGVSVPQLITPLARYLIGWRSYFGFCQTPIVVRNLDAWIRRRLRMYIWRQWKNAPNRYAQLRRLGVSHFHAAVAAGARSGYWRMARHVSVQQALPNAYFDSLGLPRLADSLTA